jgi:5-methyltetrahydropteroyltriglutamate--homocysteine methyltransferase
MKRSQDRIITTHAGALNAEPEFAALALAVRRGEPHDAKLYATKRCEAVAALVARQVEIGVDVISDGELGKSRGYPYYSSRMTGIAQRPLKEGEVPVTVRRTRERETFKDFYADLDRAMSATYGSVPPGTRFICNGPLQHRSLGSLPREIEDFKLALQTAPDYEEAFFPVIAPGWLDHFLFNEYYPSDEAFIYALADMLKPEYEAVVAAGFVLQIDDPGLPDAWSTFFPEPEIESYRKYAELRIDALNHALVNVPEDRVRYHICWGSYHGPHVDDIPMEKIVDLMLKVRAQAYSIEAANPRHEHEWKIWRDVKLPDGKILIPGVISHATNTIEHPELVADRIERFANLVGRENVIAGVDCGFGGRTHTQIGWAKLEALVSGAERASKALWSRRAA